MSSEPEIVEDESFSRNYGEVMTLKDLAGNWSEAVKGKKLTEVSGLVKEMVGSEILIRGRVDKNRSKSKLGFVNLKQSGFTVQCVAKQSEENIVGVNLIRFIKQLSRESVVDVIGVVSLPMVPITGATQEVEIQVRKVYLISKALAQLPLNVEDAARSEEDKAGKPGVNQDTRLDYRVIDLRTQANQAIFSIQDEVEHAFRLFLRTNGFRGIHTPRILGGSSEGGSAVFRFGYYEKDKEACLAQSPQLHKQMAISADFRRVFEVGHVFRAEKSSTHRHLSEYIGLDVEMEILDYSEIMDLVDELFLFIFAHLNDKCKKELETVGKQYPFKPLKFLPRTLRLTFAEGVQMLKEAGVEANPFEDLKTESERKLGQLVLEKYNTEFFILHRFPLAARPFYTMPCADDPRYSNSFDVFLRGEEIISGAQRIHISDLLKERVKECNIDVETISKYFESFRYGTPPHGGFGVGLERVVMLFCALDNIRKTSLFPRDRHRLEP